MKYFFYGSFRVKINEKISEIISKGGFSKLEFSLNEENLQEIIGMSSTSDLFGAKNLIVIDITNSEVEDIDKFVKNISSDSDIILTFFDDLDKTSKILKLIQNGFTIQEYKISKSGNVFNFIDTLIFRDATKTYQELIKLQDNEVLIFVNIVSAVRNLLSLKLDLAQKNRIIPFKLGLYKKAVDKYNDNELVEILNNLYLNDLRFKKGEITDEMLVAHSVNLFLINKNGNN